MISINDDSGACTKVRKIIAYDADPEMLFSRLRDLPDAIFLDSSLVNDTLGKYSIILVDPFAELTIKGKHAFFQRFSPTPSDGVKKHRPGSRYPFESATFEVIDDPLGVVEAMMEYFHMPEANGATCSGHRSGEVPDDSEPLPCEDGCAAGFLSYDLGFSIEKIRERGYPACGIPTVQLGLYDTAVVTDHAKRVTYLCVAECPNGRANDFVSERVTDLLMRIQSKTEPAETKTTRFSCGPAKSDFSAERYRSAVRAAKEHIYNGDIYQVNLSQCFEGRFSGDPYCAYRALRKNGPAPFSAYMSLGPLQILSGSPERFFETDGRIIRTRPIKGTRPRGKSPEQDRAMLKDLLESEKDRAELTMIVDLLRNDFGRFCRPGSVRVEKLFETEAYENVYHQVATICGECGDGVKITDILRAVFPGGSITGAPKIRAMEIIDELESKKRGIYTGSLGYMGFNGRSDLNIAIRTLVCYADRFYYQVGGGIVWDSDPQEEYEETMHKGRAIEKTLNSFRVDR